MAQQKFTISIPKGYESDERRSIGLDIIERIIDRTKQGKGKDNKDFSGEAAKYSDSYKKSFDFKLAGKGSTVNLSLSGEMLNAMEVLETSDGEITIGYRANDKFNNDKAEGNILGSYGGKPNAAKARDFLGITEDEMSTILKKYPISGDGLSATELGALLAATRESDRLADNFFNFEDFESDI
jgi:hypothetical protein